MNNIKDWPKLPATMENVRWIRDNKRARILTWPPTSNYMEVCELFVDMQTANAMTVVRDALNAANQTTWDRSVEESAAKFLRLAEFAWSRVK